MTDFSKFDEMFDCAALAKDATESQNGSANYENVPHGAYEVKIEKLELRESKKGNPMVSVWFKIVSESRYKNQLIFMNQVITQGFQLHIANEFLRSLLPEKADMIVFESFSQYGDLLLDLAEFIDGRYEYGLEYSENSKGYDTFTITDVFELD